MTWFVVLLSVCCLTVQCFPARPAGAQERPETEARTGRNLYVQYCGACHGPEGHGDGPAAPVLRTPPADLTRIAQRRDGTFPEAEITAYIDGQRFVRAHGSRDMPVWGVQFGDQFGGGAVGEEFARGHLHVLVEYLKSIQQ